MDYIDERPKYVTNRRAEIRVASGLQATDRKVS